MSNPSNMSKLLYIPVFDRLTFKKAEGHWASSSNAEKDKYKGIYPFPVEHKEPQWATQDKFLSKLMEIETYSHRYFGPIKKIGYLGWIKCRVCQCNLGSHEYQDKQTGIIWTEDMGKHYIKQHNVIPSQQFYEFIINYNLIKLKEEFELESEKWNQEETMKENLIKQQEEEEEEAMLLCLNNNRAKFSSACGADFDGESFI